MDTVSADFFLIPCESLCYEEARTGPTECPMQLRRVLPFAEDLCKELQHGAP